MTIKLTKFEFDAKMNNYELDAEYADFIIDHCAGDRSCNNGDQLIELMEEGYMIDQFEEFMVA